MDMITLLLTRPKKINLSEYVLTNDIGETTFNNLLIGLFMNGGGSTSGTGDTNFWKAVNTDRPLKFVIDATGIADVAIEACAVSTTVQEGALVAAECSFSVNLRGEWRRATIVFGFNGEDTTITVMVDKITIP